MAGNEQPQLVTVLYSCGRDLYQVPALDKRCWLSVQVYPLPPDGPGGDEYRGGAVAADGKAWRKIYTTSWAMVQPGEFATLPGDDLMVLDYTVYEG